MMKLGLTYLLFLCLSFTKGYGSVQSAKHKNASALLIQINPSSGVISSQKGIALSDDLFFIDDDDDNDDPASSRKTGSFNSSSIANNTIASPGYLSNSFKNDQRPLKPFFYSPDKNILFRVMKL